MTQKAEINYNGSHNANDEVLLYNDKPQSDDKYESASDRIFVREPRKHGDHCQHRNRANMVSTVCAEIALTTEQLLMIICACIRAGLSNRAYNTLVVE